MGTTTKASIRYGRTKLIRGTQPPPIAAAYKRQVGFFVITRSSVSSLATATPTVGSFFQTPTVGSFFQLIIAHTKRQTPARIKKREKR